MADVATVKNVFANVRRITVETLLREQGLVPEWKRKQQTARDLDILTDAFNRLEQDILESPF